MCDIYNDLEYYNKVYNVIYATDLGMSKTEENLHQQELEKLELKYQLGLKNRSI